MTTETGIDVAIHDATLERAQIQIAAISVENLILVRSDEGMELFDALWTEAEARQQIQPANPERLASLHATYQDDVTYQAIFDSEAFLSKDRTRILDTCLYFLEARAELRDFMRIIGKTATAA